MRQKSPALPANRMAKACPGVLPACLALALLLTMLSGTRHTMAAESDAGRAARADSALLAIGEDICAELMSAERAQRRLNGYQLAALTGIDPRDAKGRTRFSFFANGTVYCRQDGKSLWANYEVDGRLPPPEMVALDSPPARVVDIRFSRVAPPAPASAPDRLKTAAEAAKGALAEIADTQGAKAGTAAGGSPLYAGPGKAAAADARGGPTPIIPTSLNAVAGPDPASVPAASVPAASAPAASTAPPAGTGRQ